jgi:predicted dehydrogenase
MPQRLRRREFLQATAAAAAAFVILPSTSARTYAANDTVGVGIIGVGGQGKVNRLWLKNDGAAILALCDVDKSRAEEGLKDHADAKIYADFRKMLEAEKGLDGVMISTADHTHAVASIMAMRLGIAACTEKPLCHSIAEARLLAEVARQTKVATQLDNENHAVEGLRKIVDWVQADVIGDVREVHIWTDRPIWPQGLKERPPTKPVPANVDWDLWIGPAPFRDYHEHLHPFQWRGWWDFGTGALGDMGCHFFDSAVWALRLYEPISVEAEQEGCSQETGPNWATVTYQFPARGHLPPVTLKWYEGRKPGKNDKGETVNNVPNLPPRPEELEADRRMPTNGSLFVGAKGKILVDDAASPRLIPETKMKEFKQPVTSMPKSPGHKREWLAAIRGGNPALALSNFPDYGSRLSEVVLLGNLAIRAGKKVEWDAASGKAKNAPECGAYIKREYRKGWEV